MAWRFKASKYKNSAPLVPKFEDLIRDLSIGAYMSHGNFINASAAFMAFNWDVQGSSLAVMPLNAKGRVNRTSMPLLHAHTDMVTDFKFSPFDDGLLATGSQDLMIKLWRIPEDGLTPGKTLTPELTLPQQGRRVETVDFHPTADCILTTSAGETVTLWDLNKEVEIANLYGQTDEIQSVCWHPRGTLLASQCKDRMLRVFDPRAGDQASMECDSHEGIKDSRVVWVGGNNQERILTSGYSGNRLRELIIRDVRNLKVPQKELPLDMSSGLLVPLYDPDTNMCFLCGKGDRNIQFIEITDKDPFIVEGLKYSGDQTKGACLVPKRAMDVMKGEVNRVLQLSDSTVVPVTWQVPRKSYHDYHSDIYPETFGALPNMGSGDWFESKMNLDPDNINLDPKKRPSENLAYFNPIPLKERKTFLGNEAKVEFKQPKTPPKPNPKPRIRSTEAEPSPRPSPRNQAPTGNGSIPTGNGGQQTGNGGHQTGNGSHQTGNGRFSAPEMNGSPPDDVDDGLAMLRRQPSIKDRKRMFEENMKKSQENNGNAERTSSTPLSRSSSDEENKENKTESEKSDLNSQSESKSDLNSKSEMKKDLVELRKKSFIDSQARLQAEKAPAKRPVSKVFGRISKFKHLKGDINLKAKIDNIKNLSKTCPAECDFVHANADRIALPLSGPGGKLAILETKRTGRLTDGVTPVLIHGCAVLDFAWDPFNNNRILCACEDGRVRGWTIPNGGLTQQVNDPDFSFGAHNDKVQLIKCHPLAKDVVLTAAFDRTVRIWDLGDTDEPKIELEGHSDQIFSVSWSQCGRFVATACRDGKIRIFDPRNSPQPLVEGGEIVPKKGARIIWVLDGEYLLVTGFSPRSERQVILYKSCDLSQVISVPLDVSPAILVPFYDEDSNTLFLTGKGESTVTTFEVSTDHPHLFPLSPFKASGLHQGLAFLPKNACDIRKVEFARAYRLTTKCIEPVSFTVPRVKVMFFQDDLFPDTRVRWEATMEAQEWISGSMKQCPRISLKPDDMQELTTQNRPPPKMTQPSTTPRTSSNSAMNMDKEETKKKESDMENAVSQLVGDQVQGELEQDKFEGVEESEWKEEE